MAARQLIVPGAMPSRDANGRALPALFRFYEPDTALSTPAEVYTSSSLGTPHAFPIQSDSAGRWPQIWVDEDDYFDGVWSDLANDAPIAQYSDLRPLDDGVLASVELAEDAADRAEAAAVVSVAAANGIATNGTSGTSWTIAAESKAFTLDQTGLDYAEGMSVTVAKVGAAQNSGTGVVTDFDDPVLTVLIASTAGSGSGSAWSISQTPSSSGVTSVAGLTGAVSSGGLKTAISLDTVDNTPVLGKHAIWVPVGAMTPRTTNGAAAGLTELSGNKIMLRTLDFDASTIEYAQFPIRMPKSWNEGTVTFVPEWSHAATATNFKVSWGLQAVAISDDDALDAAFGTAQYSNDTGGTTNDAYAGPESSAITIAGTPAAQDLVIFQVLRKADDGTNDTLAIDARLHGVTVFITTDAGTDT